MGKYICSKHIDKDTIYCIISTRRLCGRLGMAGSHQSETERDLIGNENY